MGIKEQIDWAMSLVAREREAGTAMLDVARETLRHAVYLGASGLFYGVVEPLWNRSLLEPYRKATKGHTYLHDEDVEAALRMLRAGDVLAGRCEATATTNMIQWLGGSLWTHVGLYIGDGLVVEALDSAGVTCTSVGTFLKRYTRASLFRHHEAWNADAAITFGKSQMGRRYNFVFAFADGQYYCSQLVYRCFQAAGIELEEPEPDFLAHPLLPPDGLIRKNPHTLKEVWSAQREMFSSSQEAIKGMAGMGIRVLGRSLSETREPATPWEAVKAAA